MNFDFGRFRTILIRRVYHLCYYFGDSLLPNISELILLVYLIVQPVSKALRNWDNRKGRYSPTDLDLTGFTNISQG